MRTSQAIAAARKLRASTLSEEEYKKLLCDLEGRIQIEIFERNPENENFIEFSYEDDNELIIKAPYDEIYVYYLACRTDYYNEEFELYVNDKAVFDDLFEKFKNYYKNSARMPTSFFKGWWKF